MQLSLLKWEYEDQLNEVRSVEIDGKLWFVASDICSALGYKRTSETIKQHCKDRGTVKHRIPTSSGDQEMLLIDEPNVYRLVVRSQLASAERFEEWLFEEVIPEIRKKGYYGVIDRGQMPNFMKRYQLNWAKTDKGHFSVISLLYTTLYASLEKYGYTIPNRGIHNQEIRPDNSVGGLFSKYLNKYYPEHANKHKPYWHTFQDGSEFECRQYKNELMHIFVQFVEDVWIPERAAAYFAARDPKALDYLPKLISGSKAA